jgi:hypothetical protein
MKIVTTGPSEREVFTESKSERLVDPQLVAKALGAEPVYSYQVSWSEEDQEFVGICAELPSLSFLDKNRDDALKGIQKLVIDCINDNCFPDTQL